jgi:hypothetical protein
MNEISASGAVALTGSIEVGIRSYLSTHHLYASRYAAEDAQAREESLLREGVRFDMRHRGLVLMAVTEAAFFLEAAINEIFQDVADGNILPFGSLDDDCRGKMSDWWENAEKGRSCGTLDKYNAALKAAGKNELSAGAEPYQSAKHLVKLRNSLVHYKPETLYKVSRRWNVYLKYFAPNALMSDSELSFPDKVLGAGCADWAWRSAKAVTDEFAKRFGITMNYQQVGFDSSSLRGGK